jgi:hypothetical protein
VLAFQNGVDDLTILDPLLVDENPFLILDGVGVNFYALLLLVV